MSLCELWMRACARPLTIPIYRNTKMWPTKRQHNVFILFEMIVVAHNLISGFGATLRLTTLAAEKQTQKKKKNGQSDVEMCVVRWRQRRRRETILIIP